MSQLPEADTNLPPVVLRDKDIPIPENHAETKGDLNALIYATKEEFQWLDTVMDIADREGSFSGDKSVSWGAYHSSKQRQVEDAPLAMTSLLPLFPDQAKSVAMIRHSMDVIAKAVEQLNPGQIPVIAMDQPLFTIGKQIQWNWPQRYGEDKFVLRFGGLHIKMAFRKLIGDWLKDSGWVASLVEAKVALVGRADGFLKATSVTRARRAHQVTACSLYILLKKAYAWYLACLTQERDAVPFEDWCSRWQPPFHSFSSGGSPFSWSFCCCPSFDQYAKQTSSCIQEL